MYQSSVYLDVRILLSAVPGVFVSSSDFNEKKDINTVKAEFLQKNNSPIKVSSVRIEPAVLHKVTTLVSALGGTVLKNTVLESLTGNIQEPPDDRNFTGYSVRIGEGCSLNLMFHQKAKKISIEEIRIEEDSGHLTRSSGSKPHMDWTYAGCPCMRLRTKADFELGEEAELFLQELYTLMAYLKLISPELGESSIRCNAYVSMSEYGTSPDYCIKLRNLNSFNFVRKAINSELSREEEILSSGGTIQSESRLWLQDQNVTQTWKKREDSVVHFEKVVPEQIVPVIADGMDFSIKVELPALRRERLRFQFGLSRLRTEFICGEKDRADYFEEAVVCGADPMVAAHWMASELTRLLNISNGSIKQCKLTPSKFAEIVIMLTDGKIHSGMAKTLMQTICKTGEKPDTVIRKLKMELLSTSEEIEPFVDKILAQNEPSVLALKRGDMAPLEHLTGLVMKESGGLANPLTVKAIIKEKLRISVVYVFTMGGAITAKKLKNDTVAAGDAEVIKELLADQNIGFPVQVIPVSDMLSEETEPADWARLISEIKLKIESGTANGVVVTHGTDTLAYTSALLFWLFNSADVPVVLTASSTLPFESDEAKKNLAFSVKTASEKRNGVYVAYDQKLYSALNLKFLSTKDSAFKNWNMEKPIYSAKGYLSQQFMSITAPESEIIIKLMNEAAGRFSVISLYPGLRSSVLDCYLDDNTGVDNFIIELYASGTGNMRNSDYSIKNLILNGRKKGFNFFCTSKQEAKVDFSEYTTSAVLRQDGAVPMGLLTTESTVALYFAAYLIADNDKELKVLMESAEESIEL